MTRIVSIIYLILSLTLTGVSQNRVNQPFSELEQLSEIIPIIKIENTIRSFQPEPEFIPLRAGLTLPLSIKYNDGKYEKVKSGYVWRISIQVDNANQLNIYSDELNLKNGESLFIYGKDRERYQIYDLSLPNLISDFVTGNILTIEINSINSLTELPTEFKEIGILVVSGRGYGDAGNCEVKVNCIEGENWQDEKNGVARILVKEGNSTFWCTGSLINNTLHNRKPYFLTANHCGNNADSLDYSEWMFYFNYEASGCGNPSTEPEYNLITGSRLLAKSAEGTSDGSDFKLLLLSNEINPSFKPYYNGWDRREVSSPSGVTIHHPQGDIKMISTYNTPLVSTAWDSEIEDPNGFFWMVDWVATANGHGVTEGGSSGSPLFSNEGLILGSLTGGRASCSFPNQPDFYGKFSYSWNANMSDSTSNLSYWLDPLGSGVSFLKGTNFDSTTVFAGFSAEETSLVINESVSFINTSFGNISGYKWYFEGGKPSYSEEKEPSGIKYTSTGEFDVQLIAFSADNSDTLLVKDYIQVLPNISPNPGNGKFHISFGGNIPEDLSIQVFDSMGSNTAYYIEDQSNDQITIRIQSASYGIYFIRIESSVINNTYKVVVIGH